MLITVRVLLRMRVVQIDLRPCNALIDDDRGQSVVAYLVVTGSLSILILQPSLILAAVDRLGALWDLFVGNLRFVF